MKAIKHLLWMLIALSLSVCFASCGDDDEDEPQGMSIVGTWKSDNHYWGGSDTYVFHDNGTYNWSYSGSADWFERESGTYTFNGVTLTTSSNKGITNAYVIVGMNETSFVMMDEDGDKYTYYRK